jgi:hypothetical protein
VSIHGTSLSHLLVSIFELSDTTSMYLLRAVAYQAPHQGTTKRIPRLTPYRTRTAMYPQVPSEKRHEYISNAKVAVIRIPAIV